jgi:plasmid stability protein
MKKTIEQQQADLLLDKDQEISLLWKLFHGNGYFADSLCEDDIHLMTQNIRNDFPLFLGTLHSKEAEMREIAANTLSAENVRVQALHAQQLEISKDLHTEIDELKQKIQELKRQRICVLKDLTHEYPHPETIYRNYTSEEAVLVRMELGFILNDSERKLVYKMFGQNPQIFQNK